MAAYTLEVREKEREKAISDHQNSGEYSIVKFHLAESP
jgi:hypothetical protein